jgi:predicted  nucleic acid-binding Zn-ribbon protein
MTNEEMRQMMEFILQQQATFTVNLDMLREQVVRLNDAQQRTEATIGQIVKVQVSMTDVVAAIAAAQQRTDAKFAELAQAQAHTDKQLAETDERLNILVGVVERYFSEGRNGKSSG